MSLEIASSKNFPTPHAGSQILIFGFISATYTGIEMSCILSACYGNGKMNTKAEPKKLFNTFASTIIYLFGGEE